MRRISLKLNDRLNKIPIYNKCEVILDELYNNLDSKIETYDRAYLEDSYPTFYKLTKILSHNYTERELITIANYVYHLKGSIISIEEFCRLFNIDIVVNYQDFQLDVNFTLKNVYVDDPITFRMLLQKLMYELLFYIWNDFKIIDLHIVIDIVNNINQGISTKMFRNHTYVAEER